MGCTTAKQQKDTYTDDQYLKLILNYIADHQQNLCLLLDEQIFKELQQKLKEYAWPSDSKGAITRLLQDYIRISIQKTQQNQYGKKSQVDKHLLEYFGKQFGQDLKCILQKVQMKNKGIIKTLQFYPKVYEYEKKIDLDVNNPQQIIQIHNLLQTLREDSYSCQQAYFYLSLILVRVCRRLQPTSKLADLNKILGKTFQFINLDFIDTPSTQIAPELSLIYQNFREDQYSKHKSSKIIADQTLIYRSFKMQNKNVAEKQQLLEDKIMELVQDAKQKYQFFQSLFYDACKRWNDTIRINLKLKYRQNQQALQRVKQKILFRQSHRDKQLNYGSIDQLLQKQKQRRKELVQEILQSSSTIILRISDLLRGKCLFPTIQDVNQAVTKVIQKIQQKRKKNIDVQLVQIDNRLRKITNDIVLKIKIGKLVTEFQFIFYLQAHKSTRNQIYHRVYELFRSKTMSNISMLFTMHEKMAKKYIRFLKKIFDKKNIQGPARINFNDLLNNLNVSRQLNWQLQQSSSPFQKVSLKNDIISLLKVDKIDKERAQSIKQCKDLRTADCFEQIQNYEKCMDFIIKSYQFAMNLQRKEKLNTKMKGVKQKIITKKNNQSREFLKIQVIKDRQFQNLNKSIHRPQSPTKRQEDQKKSNDNKLDNNGDGKTTLQTKYPNFSKQQNKNTTNSNIKNSQTKSTKPITSKGGPVTPSNKQRSKNENPVNKQKVSIK